MEIRSFLAFELPEEIKNIVSRVSDEARKSPLDLRLVRPGNIHLTVVFMENILSEHLSGIGEAAARVCHRYGPFDISLKGTGAFGSRRNPRVLWIGLEGGIKRMAYFRDSLQKHLKPFGIKEERRPFKPHLTLGRFRRGSGVSAHLNEFLLKYQDLTSPVCPLDELVLFKSDLKPGGAVYTMLNVWPLDGTK